MHNRPIARPLDFKPITLQGQPAYLITDRFGLFTEQLPLEPLYAQLLAWCDGTRTVAQLRADLDAVIDEEVPLKFVQDIVAQFDEIGFLQTPRAAAIMAKKRDAYRAQAFRPMLCADANYPSSPKLTDIQFKRYATDDDLSDWQPWRGRGIISPHIDYQRGGDVYAKTWRRAQAAVDEAEIVIIFGTDHQDGTPSLTLTQLPYATPYGTLPLADDVVEAVAEAIGPENAFKLELNHPNEHAIELSAVWLHHIRPQNMCPVVPILCGSFSSFTPNGHPYQDENIPQLIEALQQATAGKRVLAVASVDYSHVGPVFGGQAMGSAARMQLRASDLAMRQAILDGDAERFYQLLAKTENKTNICGFSPIYLLLKFLGETQGVEIDYAHCPADPANESLVSIGGILLD